MTVELYHGDCLEVMAKLPENSVDTIITDPPYGLEFMGKDWDHGVSGVHFWEAALRVAKPGAILLAFGGTRTYHRLVCAIEDAGWEIRDTIAWIYGSGFPKSHNISKALDRMAGAEREVTGQRLVSMDYTRNGRIGDMAISDGPVHGALINTTAPSTDLAKLWDGYGTALKPAFEPICVAMAPRDGTFANNALTWGVAGLNIDGARVPTSGEKLSLHGRKPIDNGWDLRWSGAQEPHQTDGQKIGRWPANLVHDGSEEVVDLFPNNGKSGIAVNRNRPPGIPNSVYGQGCDYDGLDVGYDDSGSAARFFYCAKESRSSRNLGLDDFYWKCTKEGHTRITREEWEQLPNNKRAQGSIHPTVKPLALMHYLCKLTRTPTGGVVLDPFMGSGTTGVAAIDTDRSFIGIELDPSYFEIAKARIEHAKSIPVQKELL